MWVEYWIMKAHPSYEESEIYASKYDDSRWICEIKLPLINKTVKSIKETEVGAMLGASDKAANLINDYMRNHPELDIKNIYQGKDWIIESDEDGKYLCVGKSPEWRKQEGEKLLLDDKYSMDLMKRAIKKITKALGNFENLMIQVIPQSVFSDEMTIKEILYEVEQRIKKDYSFSDYHIEFDIKGESIIVIGHLMNKKQKEVISCHES